jgi:type I restriction enzyme S subunit
MIGRDCCIDNNMMAFRPGELVSSEYALQALSRIKFADIVNPGAVPSVNGKQIGEIPVAVPPVDEQAQIAAHLSERSAALEYAEGQVAQSCQRLAEYRSALITAAVTGQIEGLR